MFAAILNAYNSYKWRGHMLWVDGSCASDTTNIRNSTCNCSSLLKYNFISVTTTMVKSVTHCLQTNPNPPAVFYSFQQLNMSLNSYRNCSILIFWPRTSPSCYPNLLNGGYQCLAHPHAGHGEHLPSLLCMFILDIINQEDSKPEIKTTLVKNYSWPFQSHNKPPFWFSVNQL